MTDDEKEEWLAHARQNGYESIIIVKDFSDPLNIEIFPMYVRDKSLLKKMERYFISESKMKIMEILDVR